MKRMTSIKPPQKARNKLLANNIKCKLEMRESTVHYTTGFLIVKKTEQKICLNAWIVFWEYGTILHAGVIYITK